MTTSTLKRKERKYELIYQTLRQGIVAGEFRDGMLLASESQLCEQFDVSRGPVRQALAELERDGLIRRQAGKGSVVNTEQSGEPAPETGVKQLVAVLNTPEVRPGNFIAYELVDGLNHAADELGESYRLNFQFHRRDTGLESLSLPPCHGMLVAPFTFEGVKSFRRLAQLRTPRVPLASLYNRVDVENVAQFFIAHEAGAAEATELLIRYGHRRIALLTEPAISPGPAMVEREAGFRKAIEAAGLSASTASVVKVGLDPVMRLANIEHLLRGIERPTALVVAGGVITPSLIQAVRNVGLRVPQDVSMVAFDDTPEAAMHEPRLTVVRVPLRRIASMGVAWLVEQIEGQGAQVPVSIPVRPELVLGHSCGPVPGDGHM